jgi:hypothetical protein
MTRVPERNRLLVIAAAGVLIVLVVAGRVLLFGQPGATPGPSPSPPAVASVSPAADRSTPEGATRAFFAALVTSRRTDNPDLVEPFVTSREAPAYLTVAGFLAGQKAAGKASITTQLVLEEVRVDTTGDAARLTAALLEAGYDISLDTGRPLESPVTLAARRLTVELRRIGDTWKVDAFMVGAS